MADYDPFNWFWKAEDGRIYSSARQHVVGSDDLSYVEFLDNGGTPTVWPRNDDGEQTITAMLAVVEPYGLIVAQSELDAARRTRVSLLSASCAAAIVGGFRSEALGSAHAYPSDIKDQINLMGSVTDSIIPGLPENWQTPFWCRDEDGVWSWKMHSAAEIQQAGRDGKARVVACQATLETLTAAVMVAATVEDVVAIVWPES